MTAPQPSADPANQRRFGLAALLGWLVLCYAVAGLGSLTLPGAWFAALVRPPANPPAWLFAPVWGLLYTLMAIAAWLVWRRDGWRGGRAPLSAFLVQLALNACWSPLFFGLHQTGAALACIALLDLAIAVTIMSMWRRHTVAARLLIPYQAWVLFATYLNAGFWWLNRD